MSSLFRDLNRAAIDADLGKNAFKVFNTLLEQTLGYGKSTDRLTDRRLASLSQVRLDRFRPALHDVLEHALFEQRPAKKFQYRYTIGKTFLEKNGDKDFFTPALPKNRADFQKTEEISEKERHTALDLNPSLSSLLQPLQTLLSFSADILQQQMQQQAQFIQTLLQTQQNNPSNPNSPNSDGKPTVAGSSQSPTSAEIPITVVNIPNHRVDLSHITVNTIHVCESQLGHNNSHIPTPPETVLKTDRKTENSATVSNTDLKTEKQPSVKQRESSVGIDVNNQEQEQSDSAEGTHEVLHYPDALVTGLPTKDYPESYKLLTQLSSQQQEKVFVVYQDVADREGVKMPIALLRNLVHKAKHNSLVMPKSFIEANQANEPLNASMIIESSADRLERQDREDKAHEKGLRDMLRAESKRTGVAIEVVAKKKALTYLLPI